MGELVPHVHNNKANTAVAFRRLDAEEEAAAAEQRVKDANELEDKLKFINEKVPTRIYNTMSSSAGAGSGDFHQYRMVRRAEQQRQQRMEDDYKKKKEIEDYETRRDQAVADCDERTAKRRAKRLKKKGKKKAKTGPDGAAGAGSGSDSDSDAPPQVALD